MCALIVDEDLLFLVKGGDTKAAELLHSASTFEERATYMEQDTLRKMGERAAG